ncbi:MAG TPA: hypothetical protein VGC36_08365 [Rhizomicrobium sp.]
MSLLLAATAVVLSIGTAVAAPHDNHRNGRDNGASVLLGIANIAFGYDDGYWDNNRRWHRWENTRARDNYRTHGRNYSRGDHTRARNNGWRR